MGSRDSSQTKTFQSNEKISSYDVHETKLKRSENR